MYSFFSHFDAIYCINLDRRTDRWAAVQQEFEKMGIRERVVRFSAIETPGEGALGCLLSHRAIIQIAKEKRYENILIFEDDIDFIQDNFIIPPPSLPAVWHFLYLGGGFLWRDVPFLEKSGSFFRGEGIRFSHSLAYHRSIYDTILAIPHTPKGARSFLLRYDAIDAFLSRFVQKGNTTFLYFLCRQKSGVSDIGGRQTDHSGPMENNFATIKHFTKYIIFFRKALRPMFRLYWGFFWPVELLFSLIIRKIIATSVYQKYIRPRYHTLLKYLGH